MAKKSDIEEREAELVRRERVVGRKEREDADRKAILDRREQEISQKMDRVSRILNG